MIFKKLTLQNFKSHIDTEIEFNKGTTIILGDNGAGKSSIFEGINFALYKKYNTKSLNDLINTQAESMTVTLSFLIGNQEYKVKRTRSQKRSTAELFVLQDDNYHSVVSGDKEVNNHIEELLEIDADLFLNAIYIRQGEIDSLVTQKASERKKNISKLLRLDNLETSYKDIASVISNYELKHTQLNGLIDNNISEDKDALIEQKKSLKTQHDNKSKALDTLQKKMSEVKEKVDEQNALSVKFHQSHITQQRLLGELELLSKDIKETSEYVQNIKTYEDFISENEGIEETIKMYEKLVSSLEARKQYAHNYHVKTIELEEALADIYFINNICEIYKKDNIVDVDSYNKQELLSLQEIIKEDCEQTLDAKNNADEQIRDLSTKISVLNTLIANNREIVDSLNAVQNICPVCQSQIDDEHKQEMINNYSVLIAEDTDKLEKRNKELAVLQKENSRLSEMLKEKQGFVSQVEKSIVSTDIIDKIQKDVAEQKQSILDLDAEMIKLTKELELGDDYLEKEHDIHNIYNSLLTKHKEYQQAKLIIQSQQDMKDKNDDLLKQYSEKEALLEEVNQDILNIGFDSNLLQKYQTEQSQLHNQYYPLVKEVGQLENDIKYTESQIKTLDDKIKQNKLNKEQVKKLDEFIKFLKNIREIYSKDGLQKDIRLAFRPQIEKYTQDFFSKFDFDYSGLALSEDYDINIIGPSGESDISMASGGEKIAIALSLRLGIASAITANVIETILLDEPTTYLDGFRKQEFVNVIQSISLVPQMIIITHDAELENAATNVITVEKKNGQSIIV